MKGIELALAIGGSAAVVAAILWRTLARRHVSKRIRSLLGSTDPLTRIAAFDLVASRGVGRFSKELLGRALVEEDREVRAALTNLLARHQWMPADSPESVELRLWAQRQLLADSAAHEPKATRRVPDRAFGLPTHETQNEIEDFPVEAQLTLAAERTGDELDSFARADLARASIESLFLATRRAGEASGMVEAITTEPPSKALVGALVGARHENDARGRTDARTRAFVHDLLSESRHSLPARPTETNSPRPPRTRPPRDVVRPTTK